MCPLLSRRGLPLQAFQGSHPRPQACLLVSRACEALVADASVVLRVQVDVQIAWPLPPHQTARLSKYRTVCASWEDGLT